MSLFSDHFLMTACLLNPGLPMIILLPQDGDKLFVISLYLTWGALPEVILSCCHNSQEACLLALGSSCGSVNGLGENVFCSRAIL